jgi:SecD/SecF fusion protein
MQNKGFIRLFAILFALVCVYQLSFTFITKKIEKNAVEYANSEVAKKQAVELAEGDAVLEAYLQDSISKARERYYLDSIANMEVYNLLVRKYTYLECKERELNLGLDLKGGMNVTLEVSVEDVVKALAKNPEDPIFARGIALAKEKQKSSQSDFVTLFAEAMQEVAPNANLSSFFLTSELQDKITFNSTDEEVIAVIRKEANDAIERSFEIIRKRIDRFGVTQPNIQRLPTTGRILVELPGVKDHDRVRKLLQGTAQLEFWETYEYSEVYRYIEDADAKLAKILLKEEEDLAKDSLALAEDNAEKSILDGDSEQDQVETPDNDTTISVEDLTGAKETEDGTELTEELTTEERAKKNPLFTYLQPNFIQDGEGSYYPAQGPVVGYSFIKDTARVNHYLDLVQEKHPSVFPKTLKFLWHFEPIEGQDGSLLLQLIAIKMPDAKGKPKMDGSVVTDARQDFSQDGGSEISMSMNKEGAKIWKSMTGANVGKSIAIALDGLVYSFPTVIGEIPNGRTSITGQFSLQEAKDLANILKSGKLPAPARIVEEAIVGPTLGNEAISSGLMSMIIAFLLVLIFMFLYYNKAGLVADMALIVNVFFLFGVLASLQAVLTLPGIAGIVLTLGMAVDANVIIFERIKEEIRAGKGIRLAVSDGYKNAYSAIIDGNVTTLLTGVVLYIFGSGPVQGFATTLVIGILTSLFSAIFLSRLVFTRLLDKDRKIKFASKFSENAFTKIKIDFIAKRKLFYIISGLVVTIGIISLATKGLNMGVDFAGGRTYVVRFDNNISSEDVRKSLSNQFEEAPEVKTFGSSNQLKITTKYLIEEDGIEIDSIVETKLFLGVKDYYQTSITEEEFLSDDEDKIVGKLSSQKVGPTIAHDIRRNAVFAIIFALIIIFVYIAIRFRKWQFGVGGIATLAHDALIAVSMYSIFDGILPFSLEIDQSFIAAILTIIGYSINDSVIIFDRIREEIGLYPKRQLNDNMNSAINNTIGRTFMTSITTLLVLFTIFIFGGEVIRGFSFALIVGVIVGTYSSMFISTPVAYELSKKNLAKHQEKLQKK